ncbi:hypothetical protein [Pseudarthrobacter sulfonivorans]|uniref:hypothetical protein n=1 Tax=Pseudarthrobacter sulfonivorans TaxID=121292 RepID=UPI0028633F94|nr:hypothetical protein [Pseudarthrobacter sulfonivorans]MDR6413289.1 hypothetical protein [Pseudarthrobacter sulfonivorans]
MTPEITKGSVDPKLRRQPRRSVRAGSSGLQSKSIESAFLVFVTTSSFVFIGLAGQVYIAELVLSIYVFHRIASSQLVPIRVPAWTLWTLLVWLVGTIASDIALGSDALQTIRGIARIVFLAIDLIALYLLINGRMKLIFTAWIGLIAASVLSFIFQPSTFARALPWKFEFGVPVTIAVALWLGSNDSRLRWGAPALFTMTGIHFALGFRSMAVVSLLTGFILLVRARTEISPEHGRFGRWRPLVIGFGGSSAGIFLIDLYDRLAIAGTFGGIAQQKAMFQAGGDYGSLLSSRSEFFLSIGTILKQPLLGGGSFSLASPDTVQNAASLYNAWGYTSVASRMLLDVPAYHSTLLGSWAENGVLALPFWLAVLGVFIKGLVSVLYRECHAPALVALLCTSGIWDLMFSPFGAERRMWLALSVVTVITLIYRTKGIEKRATNFHCNNKL